MSDSLIQELEDAERDERLKKFWDENGGYILMGCLLAILMTAFISGWRSWNDKVNAESTAGIMAAMDTGNVAERLSSVAGQVRPGARFVAHITAAGKFAEAGEYEKALAEYNAVEADTELADGFRDLARVQAVRVQIILAADELKNGGTTEIVPESLTARLETVWGNPNSPWRFHARYYAALAEATLNKNYSAARSHLAPVLAQDNPLSTLKERAASLDHVYKLEAARNTPVDQEIVVPEDAKG